MIILRILPFSILVFAAVLGLCQADEVNEPEDEEEVPQAEPEKPWWRGPFGEDVTLISVDRTRETDPSGERLRGIRFALRMWQDEYDDLAGIVGGGYYLTIKEGKTRKIFDAGVELHLFNTAVGPVRLGPRLRLGLEYRDDEPDQGIGGVFAIGWNVAVWLNKRIQLAIMADREFGFPSGTRNQIGFSFRIGINSTPLW